MRLKLKNLQRIQENQREERQWRDEIQGRPVQEEPRPEEPIDIDEIFEVDNPLHAWVDARNDMDQPEFDPNDRSWAEGELDGIPLSSEFQNPQPPSKRQRRTHKQPTRGKKGVTNPIDIADLETLEEEDDDESPEPSDQIRYQTSEDSDSKTSSADDDDDDDDGDQGGSLQQRSSRRGDSRQRPDPSPSMVPGTYPPEEQEEEPRSQSGRDTGIGHQQATFDPYYEPPLYGFHPISEPPIFSNTSSYSGGYSPPSYYGRESQGLGSVTYIYPSTDEYHRYLQEYREIYENYMSWENYIQHLYYTHHVQLLE